MKAMVSMRLLCLFLLLTVLAGCVQTPQPDVVSEAERETVPEIAPGDAPDIEPDTAEDIPANQPQPPEPLLPETHPEQSLATQPGVESLPKSPVDRDASDEPHTSQPSLETVAQRRESARRLCKEIGTKLGSVSIEDCNQMELQHSAYTTNARSLAYKDYLPIGNKAPLGRVLLIGGIHGDEFSSVSVVFKWMEILNRHHSGLFHWRFVPAANPDGLLKEKSQRQNYNGVDLNRNFPSADWESQAHTYWVDVAQRNPRRHPGPAQASELETQWLVKQIEMFRPDVIVSMHAPFHLVDYDGPPSGPEKLGGLYLRELGVYPGSLGNYAGIGLNLPVVTVELKSAGIMPRNSEIHRMWRDLVGWLQKQLAPPVTTASSEE
jgi:murein peptide amidase A